MITNGVDVVEIARIATALERWGERFIARVWTAQERHESATRIESLAARWAAKEATAKALGIGLRGLGRASNGVLWTEIEVRRGPQGRPELVLYGAAAAHAQSLNLNEWAVSLSHAGGIAIAMVTAIATPTDRSTRRL